ncbi:MAG: TonB-dependent receptor [Gammaproteobacteria bacterium]|nr:TonB-dependent receptor [Gammaproteobacteria bacterium]
MNRSCSLRYSLFLPLAYWLFSPAVMAEECVETMATVTSAQGIVEKRQKSGTTWEKVVAQDTFCVNDMVRTQLNSRAALYLNNHSILRLNELSTVTFTGPSSQGTNQLDLKKGIAHFISRIKQRFEVLTPYVNAAVDGTEFVVAVGAEHSNVTVLEGQVRVSNEQGEIRLTQGEAAQAQTGKAPVLQTRVQPWDAVSWALYYPAVSDFSALVTAAEELPEPWRTRLLQSFEHYKQGQISAALTEIESLPGDLPNGNVYIYRAALYLAAGQAGHASIDLDHALKPDVSQDTRNGEALALKAIIAVTQNSTDLALKLAREATDASPKIAATWLAQSYAQQAVFDLEQARLSVKQAVKLAPENALAWARLAELHLMFGELDHALQAAYRATEIAPRLARTQSVLGFAYLTRIKIAAAEQAFNQAIELDQAAPLPRLGLGLAMIRRGELAPGRHQIEIAASLAPANPLIRSYLGKAYYEEKRGPLDATQFALAKELDPNDPTPWFYDAIRKQTENRPIEALRDLEKSTELNDNRAVYRSRLLLDGDQATKGASQGRVYSDLGFQQLALVEGWKSVNTDFSNYSAHRLLADSYSVLPRHEIARVSELLQAQLLQPINVNPLQPQLGEGSLGIVEGAGSAGSSFNEFNPLFIRNQVRFQANGIGGSNNTWGDDLVLSGVQDRISYSVGRFHYESDGIRENNDQEQSLYNAFLQLDLSPTSSVQLEVQTRKIELGDLPSRFDGSFSPANRRKTDTDSLRLGARFKPTPASNVLVSVIYEDEKDVNYLEKIIPPFVPFVVPILSVANNVDNTDGVSLETQYLIRMDRVHVIAGVGRLSQDKEVKGTVISSSGGALLPPPFSGNSALTNDIKHDNAYLYSTWTTTPELKLTLGVSYDDFDSDAVQNSKWNPKAGLIWNATPRVTLRLAGFKVLRRSLFRNRTIEPTQVSGFNQFFDDSAATKSTRIGIGLDYKSRNNGLYTGMELTERNMQIPTAGIKIKQGEFLHRAYLYWTVSPSWALRAEYQYDDFETDIAVEGLEHLRTQSLPLAVHYYHFSQLFAKFGATYVDQEVGISEASVGEQFWVTDLSVGYRLPQRLGNVSLLVKNLFDENFSYQDDNFRTNEPRGSLFQPERTVFVRLSLVL